MRMRVSIDGWRLRICAAWTTLALAGCGGDPTTGTGASGQGASGAGGTSTGGTGTGTTGMGGGGTTGTGTGGTSAGGTGGTNTGGTTTSTSSTAEGFPCEDPMPVIVGGETGYVLCKGGWMHRPEVMSCPVLPPNAPCDPMGGTVDCVNDSDCVAMPNGRCAPYEGGFVPLGCFCQYGCGSDTGCGAGAICFCDEPVSTCVSASCTSDADCGTDALCASYTQNPGCPGIGFACQTPADTCAGDADCPVDHQCTYDGSKHVCGPNTCVVGRPFLVDGSARVAEIACRADWHAPGADPRAGDLEPEVRAVLAEEWTRAGLMEHASIAAFARFALQLLAAGAPPDLVAAAHAAMADETEHARACFALASAYAGRDVGPGRLSMQGALAGEDLATAVRLAILEGCIGETVAAVEAAEASAHAVDPVVRGVLARIAEDETRHAELAWRWVRWALAEDPSLARVVGETFREALAEERRGPAGATATDEAWLHHGVARGTVKADIRRQVIDGVVAPAARSLLRLEERASRQNGGVTETLKA